MEKYRHIIGWGAIVVAALNFLPLPLPALPPMLTGSMLLLLPGLGPILMMLSPMLLFAAGIGLVKGWDGGRKLFVVWSVIGGLSALAGLEYDLVRAVVDLAVIGASLTVVLWGDWRRLLPRR
ncbi:hypothetical protein [Sphingorhabdus sp. M41]|uniref:hypothetical protein n=1 Tax=Sphingorhabdus sp. M41 TaxID=1806885 RepID=UPI00078E7832|nr:hypothetical protein [Sphingorhabdus sp. M41]AMO72326.1 hypothetical protein AZE99_11100 [Sphingorhabdus sp. M41]